MAMIKNEEAKTETDIYRDTPIRLLGYANEVGEAFRSLVNVNWVRLSYVISSSYCVADTFDKGAKVHKKEWENSDVRRKAVTVAAVDTLLWQGLASVAIPGFTINRICFISQKLIQRLGKVPKPVQKWGSTLIGLGAIPFIVHPIDTGVHMAMDATVRPYLGVPAHYQKETNKNS